MAEFVFPKVELTDPKFSNRSFTVPRRTSLAPGVLVPIFNMRILPGDELDLKLNALLESFPMLAPMLGTMHLRFDFFFEPDSNLYGWMDNNVRNSVDSIINHKYHCTKIGQSLMGTKRLSIPNDPDNKPKNGVSRSNLRPTAPSSLLNYLGVPAGFFGETSLIENDLSITQKISQIDFPLNSTFAYIDIIRNYYVNNQESSVPFIRGFIDYSELETDDTKFTENLPIFDYENVSLEHLDGLFKQLRNFDDGHMITNTYTGSIGTTMTYVDFLATLLSPAMPLRGLALRTYKMDLLRGIMMNDPDSYKTFIGVDENGRTTVEDIRFANKMQMFKERIELTNGRFKDWMKTIWNVSPNSKLDIPYYLGSVSQYIYNNDIIATASGSNVTQNVSPNSSGNILGQQAGFWAGRISRENDVINLKSNEYGTFMVIASLVPIVDYSQGFELADLKTKFLDEFYPQFAQLGFQDVSRFEFSALPEIRNFAPIANTEVGSDFGFIFENSSKDEVVGKRVAWSEYMSGLGRNFGDFAYGESLDYWANNRLYTRPYIVNPDLLVLTEVPAEDLAFVDRYGKFDSSTYVQPDVLNGNFANASPDAQNFRLQCVFDVHLVRPIPKQTMPRL